MYDIFELNDMSFAEIREIAMKLGLESTNVEKEHLIYNIINKLESGYEEKLEEGNEEKKEEEVEYDVAVFIHNGGLDIEYDRRRT